MQLTSVEHLLIFSEPLLYIFPSRQGLASAERTSNIHPTVHADVYLSNFLKVVGSTVLRSSFFFYI